MSHLHIDFETHSAVDLKKAGAYVYAEHESTDVWCAAYAIDDGPVELWLPGQPIPDVIFDHIIAGGEMWAHNANFERVIFRYVMGPRYGWPVPDVEQWRCTMTQAYALALPGGLDDAARAVGLDHRKDAAGYRLMLQMGRPRKVHPDGRIDWWDQPEKIERLAAYCRQDVEVERALAKRLRPLKPSELALWHLDQHINDRGVFVDVPLAEAAKKVVHKAADDLDAEMRSVTGFAVTACSNRNQLITWVREKGIDTESIAKDVVEELLANRDLPADVRRALTLRLEAAKASVAKIVALLVGSNLDGRARGLLQWHAATTGRWGGRRFQPQNIVRPDEDFPVDAAIEAILGDYLDILFDAVIHAVSQCLRGMVRAAPGKRIIALDYSNIEGRVLAWLAGEQTKLDAFRAYDAGTGHDLYKITAGGILGKDPGLVTKAERQAYGKVPELALGYQGGVGAFQTMAVNYGVDLADEEVERIRDGWRARHPHIKQFWADMEEAAIAAVERPGSTTQVRDIVFRVAGSFLFMRLPSKRFLAYPFPAIRPKRMPWANDDGSPVWKDSLTYFSTIDVSKRRKVVEDPNNTGSWARIASYGGMLAENATQAVARDILADAMPRLEAAGYPIVLTVHDEIVAEVLEGHGSVDEMREIMTTLPEWAAGCPVAADGFEAERYRK